MSAHKPIVLSVKQAQELLEKLALSIQDAQKEKFTQEIVLYDPDTTLLTLYINPHLKTVFTPVTENV